MTENIKQSVTMTPELQDEIEKYALNHRISKSQAIRSLLEKALSQTALIDEQNEIRGYIREELKTTLEYVLNPYFKCFVEYIASNARTSAASLLCLAIAMPELYPEWESADRVLAYANNMATRVTKDPVKPYEEYLAEAREWLGMTGKGYSE